jgi:hypothetical protein
LLDVSGSTSARSQAALWLAPLWRTVLPRDLRGAWSRRRRGQRRLSDEQAVSYHPAAPSGGLMKKMSPSSLPMTTTATVGTDRVVRWIEVHPDYSTCTGPGAILTALDGLGW